MEDKLLQKVERELAENRMVLPTPPDVALRVRKVVQRPGATAAEVAASVSGDPALAARLIKVANSVLLRGTRQIADLQGAVTRLGLQLVHTLVTGATMMPLFAASHPVAQRQLRTTWDASVRVAAHSHAIAAQHTSLDPDRAMLAGLLHDIGRLPILRTLQQWPALLAQERLVGQVLDRTHARAGALVLEQWNLPEDIVAVAREHENPHRGNGATPSFLDVVQAALIASYGPGHPVYANSSWQLLPALRTLKLDAATLHEPDGKLSVAAFEVRNMLTA